MYSHSVLRCYTSFFFIIFCTAAPAIAQERLQSPAEFLGYEIGEHFTPHHRVVDYVRHVAEVSPRVDVASYGTTYEERPLLLAFVSSPGNLARREDIRRNNLRRTGLLAGAPEAGGPAIVWLSYSVHGDEASGTEAALATLYALADPANEQTGAWLENVLVILDPSLNPDGRQRYVQWYRQTRGKTPNAQVEAREHYPPWPSGRTNHYYFDLNRDWSWATQRETRARLEVYNRWMPHVHADLHEQGYNAHYFFPPAAEPLHEVITPWQRKLMEMIGAGNKQYFNRRGWLYFTREVYDLVYPGYGDTWPLFNGAVGMTYEQAGSGRAGLAIETTDGDTLTLTERARHHAATSLTTIEVAAENHEAITAAFADYFERARNGEASRYESFLIKASSGRDRIKALKRLLDLQGIRYRYASGSERVEGFRYRDRTRVNVEVAPGDLIVPTTQPKGVLARVLFEPSTALSDSVTYDITAWALPYVYGLDAYALSESVPTVMRQEAFTPHRPSVEEPYAYIAEWQSFEDAQFLAALLEEGIRLRIATEPFTIEDDSFGRGALIISRSDNEHVENFDARMRALAAASEQPLYASSTGAVTSGADFGSSSVRFVQPPDVAILSGRPTTPGSLGEIWHFFDRQLRYPTTLFSARTFGTFPLDDYDVLILPDGAYEEWLTEERLLRLTSWIEAGGRVIALGDAVGALADMEAFTLESADTPTDTSATLDPYAERQRREASNAIPGAIFRVTLDPTHPLAFGYGDHYFTLKRGADAFSLLTDGWNVGVLQEDAHMSGFAGQEARQQVENSLILGIEPMGEGQIIYFVDDPLFRGFWYNGRLLFSNAVFMVGN